MPKNIYGIKYYIYHFRGHLQNIITVGKMGTKQPKNLDCFILVCFKLPDL